MEQGRIGTPGVGHHVVYRRPTMMNNNTIQGRRILPALMEEKNGSPQKKARSYCRSGIVSKENKHVARPSSAATWSRTGATRQSLLVVIILSRIASRFPNTMSVVDDIILHASFEFCGERICLHRAVSVSVSDSLPIVPGSIISHESRATSLSK